MSMRTFASLLVITLSIACNGPREAAAKYEAAEWRGDHRTAYDLVASRDKAVKSLDEYAADQSSGLSAAVRKSYSAVVKDVKEDGMRATATVVVSGTNPFTGQPDSSTETLTLLKEREGWRVLAGWAAAKAVKEGQSLAHAEDWRAAKAKLEEALKESPDDPEARKALAEVDRMLASVVAGKWFKQASTNAMTDDNDVMIVLPAEKEISGSFGSTLPELVARCKERKLSLFVISGEVLRGSTADSVQARCRFGSDSAETLAMDSGQDFKTVFFRHPERWMERLEAKNSSTLNIELPFYSGQAIATFNLDGAEQALPQVKSGCGVAAK
jgi:hypothetical protein